MAPRSRSGWYSTSADKRRRKPVTFTLAPDTLAALDVMAKAANVSRSVIVDRLVLLAREMARAAATVPRRARQR